MKTKYCCRLFLCLFFLFWFLIRLPRVPLPPITNLARRRLHFTNRTLGQHLMSGSYLCIVQRTFWPP